jgi:hypothetical protein
MKIIAARLMAPLACSLILGGVAAVPIEAGIVPCIWNTLFGPGCGSGGNCGANYGPGAYGGGGCSSGNCGTAYYAPGNCGACAPCGGSACAPCAGSACAPYSSGDCVPRGQSPAAPRVDDQWKKKRTFDQEESSGVNGGGAGSTGGAGSSGRTIPDSGLDGTKKKPDGLQDDGESTEAFKKPAEGEAAEIEPTGGSAPTPVHPKGKKSPSPPKIPDDNDESGSLRAPSINLDEKIAWRAAPERKRATIKKDVANARLIRLPAYPRSDWLPVDPESNVARK